MTRKEKIKLIVAVCVLLASILLLGGIAFGLSLGYLQ